MGNDGGSIPTRRELVKEAARNRTTTEIKESQQEQLEYNWTTCPLSHRPLAQPVVSDYLGKLYNKDAILQFLLPSEDGVSKADSEEFLGGRIRSLKDVVEVKFEVEKPDGTKANNGARHRGEIWVCPVTRKELGPNVRSTYISPCGHAFSESAIKELSEETCLQASIPRLHSRACTDDIVEQCNEPFTSDNVIPILPMAAAEIERLSARAKSLKEKGLTHSLKKAPGAGKKRKKNGELAAVENGVSSEAENQARSNTSTKASTPQPNGGTATPSSTIRDAATASLTARVMEHEMERNKRRKLGMNENLKGLFSSGNDAGKGGRNGDFMTRGYSIPADAKR